MLFGVCASLLTLLVLLLFHSCCCGDVGLTLISALSRLTLVSVLSSDLGIDLFVVADWDGLSVGECFVPWFVPSSVFVTVFAVLIMVHVTFFWIGVPLLGWAASEEGVPVFG